MAPIIVAGALSTASGLGQSARLCHDALQEAGLPVLGIDLSARLMQPEDAPGFAFTDASRHTGPATVILHVNAPLVPLAMLRLGRKLVRDACVVGYWAWELPRVPDEWRHGLPFVHHIWVPSAFTAEAVRGIVRGRSVHVVPHPVALATTALPDRVRRSGAPFTVLTMFNAASSVARKNPLAAIAAFKAAFGDAANARLIIKTTNLSQYCEGLNILQSAVRSTANIELVDRTLTVSEINALYSTADVFLSLHRSEGFGLSLAEAMLAGVPVVATDWSGNVDFLNAVNGLPVPYRLVPARDPQETYDHPETYWAEPDVASAAAALLRVARDPAFARRLADAAKLAAVSRWSTDAYATTVRDLLALHEARPVKRPGPQ